MIIFVAPASHAETGEAIHDNCRISFTNFKVNSSGAVIASLVQELVEKHFAYAAPAKLRRNGEEQKLGLVADRPAEGEAGGAPIPMPQLHRSWRRERRRSSLRGPW